MNFEAPTFLKTNLAFQTYPDICEPNTTPQISRKCKLIKLKN